MIFFDFCFFILGFGFATFVAVYISKRNKIRYLQENKEIEIECIQTVNMLKHDLNSPLTAIILGLQSIENEESLLKITKVLGILNSSALQMKIMIQENGIEK